ncbi:MAG TPA: c-type cytochrome, partial [Thermoanaerobaculia bacterium]|nr:c-type cytochrome [Thermoanaerobaculia bacterium]
MLRIHLAAGSLLALLALTLSARNAGSQTPPAKPAAQEPAPAATAPAPLDPPAEKVFKNIKVLTGMPASQMFPVMGLMRSSLGVGCDFCHEAGPDKFDLDTKKEKQAAREMIRMVFEINKNHFEGKTEITCNSCHHGETHPIAVPTLSQGQLAADGTSHPAQAQREGLPKPAQILDRYLAALGGREALAAVRHRISRGTVLQGKLIDAGTPKMRVENRGEEGKIEIEQAPGTLRITITAPSGKTVETFDGKSGTIENAQGRRPMDPEELRRAAEEADLHRELALKPDRMRVVSRTSLDGRSVYVVRGALPDGRRATFYFDAENGLLTRRVVLSPTILGADPEQTDYSAYIAVGAVKVPSVVKISYLDDDYMGTTRKLTEIRE